MTWWKTAKAGDKIVCINQAVGFNHTLGVNYIGGLDGLTENQVYTVVEIMAGPRDVKFIVILKEIKRRRPTHHLRFTEGFDVRRFKPVEKNKTKTGMKILKKLLKTNKILEPQ